MVCKATVQEVQINRETGAILPRKVSLVWPAQRVQMDLQIYDLRVVHLRPQAGHLFQRRDLTMPSFDLARWAPDGQDLQRASSPLR